MPPLKICNTVEIPMSHTAVVSLNIKNAFLKKLPNHKVRNQPNYIESIFQIIHMTLNKKFHLTINILIIIIII